MGIADGRSGQAARQESVGVNRFGGVGGSGSGMQAMLLLDSKQPTNGAGTGTGAPIVVAGSTINFHISRPGRIFLVCAIPTGGNAGNAPGLSIQVDGNISGQSMQGGAAVQAPTMNMSTEFLQPGPHSCAMALAQSVAAPYSWGVGTFFLFLMGA